MIKKISTACCALCQLSISNNDSYEDIKAATDKLKANAVKINFNPEITGIGERACFVITTSNETNLISNLIKLDFKKVNQFNRRKGYDQKSNLIMWMLNW